MSEKLYKEEGCQYPNLKNYEILSLIKRIRNGDEE